MSELAFNLNGEPFEVPVEAVGWRVRKMKSKGAPEVVYGRNGMPLVLPIEADLDDVRAETTASGRYRLDPVADGNRPIPDSPVGYVYVHEPAQSQQSVAEARLPAATDNIAIEAMRMNAEIAKSVVERFPQMLEAASTLLRAADGAGLPSRLPPPNAPHELVREMDVEEDEEDAGDDEQAPVPGFDLNALVAQIVPILVTTLMSGNLKIPGLGEIFDWRKASAAGKASAKREAPRPTEDINNERKPPEPPAAAASGLPPLGPETLAHFLAIQSELKPDEAALARGIAADLAPKDLRAWFDDLKKLTVPDAVAKVRATIGKSGGAA